MNKDNFEEKKLTEDLNDATHHVRKDLIEHATNLRTDLLEFRKNTATDLIHVREHLTNLHAEIYQKSKWVIAILLAILAVLIFIAIK